MSLRARLALLFGLLTAAGIAVVALLVFQSADTELAAETDDFLEQRADDVIEGRRLPSRDRGRREPPPQDTVQPDLAFDPDAVVQTIDTTQAFSGNAKASTSSVAWATSATRRSTAGSPPATPLPLLSAAAPALSRGAGNR